MRKQKGITLIALVITIIVLIILAGVSINLVLSQNGIIGKAIQGKEDYEKTATNEEEQLNELYAYIARADLPENTPEMPQDIGKIVKVPEEWATESVKYIKTSDGLEATELTKVATVYAVSVGNGETVPVPIGFYYVGGNLDTGVIISDNEADKYDGKIDKTTYDYTTSLVGNQFVWIPCEVSKYKKCATWSGKKQTNGTLANTNWDTTTSKSELTQIEKYGGFYVGRYEAGLAETIQEFTTNQKHTTSNQIYNLAGVPQSKAGVIPWMFIDWEQSKLNAESMYNNNYVSSGLITGTQWDVILNTLIDKTDLTDADMINSSTWGNYRENSISYKGRLARADYNISTSRAWTLKPFEIKTTATTSKYASENTYGDLLTTGASSIAEKYHIFDLAGNLWEWTEENSIYTDSGQYRVARGGDYLNTSSDRSVCYRGYEMINKTAIHIGFRTVLYIK